MHLKTGRIMGKLASGGKALSLMRGTNRNMQAVYVNKIDGGPVLRTVD